MTRIYLSGAITGNPDYKKMFMEAEKSLDDFEVVNPVRIGDALAERLKRTPTYEEYMRADIAELVKCDEILMLGEWWKSNGANTELAVAKSCGLKVNFQVK